MCADAVPDALFPMLPKRRKFWSEFDRRASRGIYVTAFAKLTSARFENLTAVSARLSDSALDTLPGTETAVTRNLVLYHSSL
jgi:hypothetical protein